MPRPHIPGPTTRYLPAAAWRWTIRLPTEPPAADPNDDGLNFQYQLTADDVVVGGVVVRNVADQQLAYIAPLIDETDFGSINYGMPQQYGDPNELLAARAQRINDALSKVETTVDFKLVNMQGNSSPAMKST